MPTTILICTRHGTLLDVIYLIINLIFEADSQVFLLDRKDYWLDVVKRLWPKFQHFPLDKADAHPCNFTDIISQDMAAAYVNFLVEHKLNLA